LAVVRGVVRVRGNAQRRGRGAAAATAAAVAVTAAAAAAFPPARGCEPASVTCGTRALRLLLLLHFVVGSGVLQSVEGRLGCTGRRQDAQMGRQARHHLEGGASKQERLGLNKTPLVFNSFDAPLQPFL